MFTEIFAKIINNIYQNYLEKNERVRKIYEIHRLRSFFVHVKVLRVYLRTCVYSDTRGRDRPV